MMIDTNTLLAWGAVYKKVVTDEIIFREGTEAHFYYQLAEGSVRWVNITDEGREFIQDIIEPGECFGELPLFDDSGYACTAIANKESVVLRLHKASFLQLLQEEPAIHFAFTQLLTRRLRFKFLLTKELACCSPEHRILTLFSYFKASRKNICCHCNQIKLTRQQIADMTGLRVETVIRSIRQLQYKGELVIDKGKVLLAL